MLKFLKSLTSLEVKGESCDQLEHWHYLLNVIQQILIKVDSNLFHAHETSMSLCHPNPLHPCIKASLPPTYLFGTVGNGGTTATTTNTLFILYRLSILPNWMTHGLHQLGSFDWKNYSRLGEGNIGCKINTEGGWRLGHINTHNCERDGQSI